MYWRNKTTHPLNVCKTMSLRQWFLEAVFHLRSTVDKLSLKWQEMNFSRLSRFANIFHNNISIQHIVIIKYTRQSKLNHFQKDVYDFYPIKFYLKRNLCFWFLMMASGWCQVITSQGYGFQKIQSFLTCVYRYMKNPSDTTFQNIKHSLVWKKGLNLHFCILNELKSIDSVTVQLFAFLYLI